jgi:uracil-DNA glycosylase
VTPKLVVAMGATALFALTGNGKDITKRRGKLEKTENGLDVFVTYHPSAILRNHEAAETIRRDFFADIASMEKQMHEQNGDGNQPTLSALNVSYPEK